MLKNKTKPTTSLPAALPLPPHPNQNPLARPHAEIQSMGLSQCTCSNLSRYQCLYFILHVVQNKWQSSKKILQLNSYWNLKTIVEIYCCPQADGVCWKTKRAPRSISDMTKITLLHSSAKKVPKKAFCREAMGQQRLNFMHKELILYLYAKANSYWLKKIKAGSCTAWISC